MTTRCEHLRPWQQENGYVRQVERPYLALDVAENLLEVENSKLDLLNALESYDIVRVTLESELPVSPV